MKLAQIIHDRLHRDTPRQAIIKWKAHAATTACAALIVPSACAFYIRHIVSFASRIWEVHTACVLLAVFFWLTEKPRLAKYVSDQSDLVADDSDER